MQPMLGLALEMNESYDAVSKVLALLIIVCQVEYLPELSMII